MSLQIEEFTLEFRDDCINVYWGDRGFILKTIYWLDSLTAIDDCLLEIQNLLEEWDIDTDTAEIRNKVSTYYANHIFA